jgi:pyruvyl transferase EpsO
MSCRTGRTTAAAERVHGDPPRGDDALIARLGGHVQATLARTIAPGRSVVLLDIPTHANVGDNAILLGELAALRALGRQVLYVPASSSTEGARLRRRIGSRPILLHGGGNFGDLWPAHQRLREHILAEFPYHPVVQLPQSIAFDNADSVARARRAFQRHGRFTLLVRDHQSRVFAEDQLGMHAILTPDAAFALGRLRAPGAPSRELLLLARRDHEARGDRRLPSGVVPEDWTQPELGLRERFYERIAGELDRRPGRSDAASATLARASLSAWARLSREHLWRGMALLGSAQVVVTDRLHGHILSLLLGIPHVVSDNVSGKIRGFYETWTGDAELVTWAGSLEQGVELARGLAPARNAGG